MLRGTAGLASSNKESGRQQYSLLSLHFSTAHYVTSILEARSFDLQRTQLCGHLFAAHPPTWPRIHLLLVQRPGRQPFSKRHAQARDAGASHLFSFLVLSTALIRNGFSNILRAWIYMQAITLLSLLLPLHRNLAEHTLTLLFTYYIIYCHVSWKPKTLLRHFRCRLSHYSTRACYFFLFSKALHCKENC